MRCNGFPYILLYATAGSDFNSFSETITFLTGQTDAQQSVSLSSLDDEFKEVDETITCSLEDSPDQLLVTPVQPSVANITIQDNDS